jgi:hypothetical protein
MLVSFFIGPSFPAQQTLAEKKLAQSRTKLSTEEQARQKLRKVKTELRA